MSDIVERRMDAYYYSFTLTGVDAVDKVLGAVACAGKAFHHTTDWNDEVATQYDDHTGGSPVDWIQNAGIEAADEITRLRAEVERLRAALKGLLSCPAIADGNHGEAAWGCPETFEAEKIARTALGDTHERE